MEYYVYVLCSYGVVNGSLRSMASVRVDDGGLRSMASIGVGQQSIAVNSIRRSSRWRPTINGVLPVVNGHA